MRFYRAFICITLFLLLFTSCSSGKLSTAKIKATQTSVPSQSTSKPVALNIDELKATIKKIINDDIWYNGPYSEYKNLQMQKSEIEIYRDNAYPNDPLILFDKGFRGMLFSSDIQYFSIGLHWNDRTNTYENWSDSGYVDKTLNETRSEILSYAGAHLIQKTDIAFGKVQKPVFTPPSEKKEKIMKEILKRLPDLFNGLELNGGKREVQIKNFSENDYSTTVIFKDDNDDLWYADFNIDEDDQVPTLSYFSKVDSDYSKYEISQYLKVSIKKEVNYTPVPVVPEKVTPTPVPEVGSVGSLLNSTSPSLEIMKKGGSYLTATPELSESLLRSLTTEVLDNGYGDESEIKSNLNKTSYDYILKFKGYGTFKVSKEENAFYDDTHNIYYRGFGLNEKISRLINSKVSFTGLSETPQKFNFNSKEAITSYQYDMNGDGVKDNISLVYNGDLFFKVNQTEISFTQNLDEYGDNTIKDHIAPISTPDISISKSTSSNSPIVKIIIGFEGADNYHFHTWTFKYPKDAAAYSDVFPGLLLCDQFETDFRGSEYEYHYFRYYKGRLEEIQGLSGLKNNVKAGILQSIFLNGSFDPNNPQLLKGTAAEGTKLQLLKEKLGQLTALNLIVQKAGKYYLNLKLLN